jgi:HSP20 family protein
MTVKMDLPGLQKDKINIKIENDQFLKISGSRETEKLEEKNSGNATYSRLERQHGAFERTIKLPVAAKSTGTQAKYENGVLTVTIPKAKEAKKEVSIPVA